MVSPIEWMESHPEYPWMVECWNLAVPRITGAYAPKGSAGGLHQPTFFEPCMITKPEHVWVHPTARIDSFVKLEGGEGLWIGPYVHIASFCHVGAGGGRTVLEEGCTLASHTVVCSGQSEGAHPSAADPKFKKKTWDTIIGHHTVIFAGCVIVNGIGPEKRLPAGTIWRNR